MKNNSLKKLYSLEYCETETKTNLTNWFNKLILKSENELDVFDVSRMIRQNILREIAINRAIELFIIDPYDGEMVEGDLIALLVSCGKEIYKSSKACLLPPLLLKLEKELSEYDWIDYESMLLFKQNIFELKKYLKLWERSLLVIVKFW